MSVFRKKWFWMIFTISLLLFVSGVFDIWSTLRIRHVELLEANPIFLLTQNIWFVVVVKLFMLSILVFLLFFYSNPQRILKHSYISYFYFLASLLIILLQFFAGFSNLRLADNIVVSAGVDSVSDLSYGDVESFNTFSSDEKISLFYRFVLIIFGIPFCFGFVSFVLWFSCVCPDFCLLCRLSHFSNEKKEVVKKVGGGSVDNDLRVEVVDI